MANSIRHDRLRPYESYSEYLSDELLKLDLLLQSILENSSNNEAVEDEISSDLFFPREYVDKLLATGSATGKNENEFLVSIEQKTDEITERLRITENALQLFPSQRIKSLFSLNPVEYQALFIAFAPVLDSKYEKIYAYINNSLAVKYPTVQLLYNMYCKSPEEISVINSIFSMNAPLVSWKLLHVASDNFYAGASRTFTLDSRIADYLLENKIVDRSLSKSIHFYNSNDIEEEGANTDNGHEHVSALVQYVISEPNKPAFILCAGESTKAKIQTAARITHALSCPLLYIYIGKTDHLKLNEIVMRIKREAILFQSSVFLDFGEDEDTCNEYLRPYSEACEDLHLPVFFGVGKKYNKKLINVAHFFELKFDTPSRTDRSALWRKYIRGSLPVNGTAIDYIIDQFKFSEEQIENAVQVAQRNSILNGNKKLAPDDILAGCRSQTDHNLKTMGVKLDFKFNLDDIVLPNDRIEHLQEIVNQYKHRTQVLENWGFKSKVAYGNGLTVLFSGPSGTGKTMAASVIASELKLDIYKIDLSSVVSKYIGETEKNLSRIFDE
ncbi:MAG: AAA family ATPase, partial [Leptospirales bacterium]